MSAKLISTVLVIGACCAPVLLQAQSRWTISLVGATNIGDPNGIHPLASQSSTTGALSQTSTNTDFTGNDRNGVSRTMNFQAVNRARADYGQLRVFASASVANTYYNAANPTYYNFQTGQANPGGSPTSLVSLGFAGFNDTLQFEGNLQSGYRARYIFKVDGVNTGVGGFAGMSVGIAGNPDESFFATSPGSYNEIWATQSYEINGITPQTVNVQFSNQVVFDTDLVADGSNLSGMSDFESTLTLTEIQILNASGAQVFDVSATSASGTIYQTPEPLSMMGLGLGIVALLKRRARK